MAEETNTAAKTASRSKMVVVGCKLPHGLHLDHGGRRVTINGANSSRLVGGYGFTEIDREFWEAWLEGHKEYPPVVHGLVYAQTDAKSAESKADEQAGILSGFEPIDPASPGPGIEPVEEG